MFGELTKILKNLGIIALVVAGLVTVGNGLDMLINWQYLVIFFRLIRKIILNIDFALDTQTLLTLVGYMLIFQVSIWGFRGLLWAVNRLNKK